MNAVVRLPVNLDELSSVLTANMDLLATARRLQALADSSNDERTKAELSESISVMVKSIKTSTSVIDNLALKANTR